MPTDALHCPPPNVHTPNVAYMLRFLESVECREFSTVVQQTHFNIIYCLCKTACYLHGTGGEELNR